MEIKLDSFYQEITPKYLSDRLAEIDDLTALIDEKNFEQIESKFHRLAGSGGGFGLQIITEIASLIEKASVNEDFTTVEVEFKKYIDTIKAIRLSFL